MTQNNTEWQNQTPVQMLFPLKLSFSVMFKCVLNIFALQSQWNGLTNHFSLNEYLYDPINFTRHAVAWAKLIGAVFSATSNCSCLECLLKGALKIAARLLLLHIHHFIFKKTNWMETGFVHNRTAKISKNFAYDNEK